MPFISLNDERVRNAEAVMTGADRDISPFPRPRRIPPDDCRPPQPRSLRTDEDADRLIDGLAGMIYRYLFA
jgi:hypothetical protein